MGVGGWGLGFHDNYAGVWLWTASAAWATTPCCSCGRKRGRIGTILSLRLVAAACVRHASSAFLSPAHPHSSAGCCSGLQRHTIAALVQPQPLTLQPLIPIISNHICIRYLEDIHLTTTWQQFYDADPAAGITDPLQLQRVLGGEACMYAPSTVTLCSSAPFFPAFFSAC